MSSVFSTTCPNHSHVPPWSLRCKTSEDKFMRWKTRTKNYDPPSNITSMCSKSSCANFESKANSWRGSTRSSHSTEYRRMISTHKGTHTCRRRWTRWCWWWTRPVSWMKPKSRSNKNLFASWKRKTIESESCSYKTHCIVKREKKEANGQKEMSNNVRYKLIYIYFS